MPIHPIDNDKMGESFLIYMSAKKPGTGMQVIERPKNPLDTKNCTL